MFRITIRPDLARHVLILDDFESGKLVLCLLAYKYFSTLWISLEVNFTPKDWKLTQYLKKSEKCLLFWSEIPSKEMKSYSFLFQEI